MNHIYKSIFNKALGVFTAVPEFASAHGKGSERAVVGRVAKGTTGFAASALAISVGLALTSTSAVASAGIYVNDGTDNGCLALPDSPGPYTGIYGIVGNNISEPNSMIKPGYKLPDNSYLGLDQMNPCYSTGNSVHAAATQTNRTLFYGSTHTVDTTNNGAKNLTLGGRLDVNSGIIGVGDRGVNGAGATNSIRMGTGTTLDEANKKLNSISIGVDAGASHKEATAIGSGTTAKTGYSTALGYQAQAGDPAVTNYNGEYATAIGGKAKALHAYTTALGSETTASGAYALAAGHQAKATHESTTAVGTGAKAINEFATAMGQLALASGKNSTAVGTRNEALGEEATAIGYHSHANGSQQLSIGAHAGRNLDGSFTQSTHGISIGSLAGADNATAKSNDDSVLIGTESGRYAQGGNRNTSIGKSAGQYLNGSDNIAMGSNAGSGTATDKLEVSNTVAIGNTAKASGNDGIALGNTANSKTDGAISIGTRSVSGDGDAVPGVTPIGNKSISIGYDSVANRYDTIAMGVEASTQAADSAVAPWDAIAIGSKSKATTYKALAIGAYSQATGRQSTVIGNDIQGQNSTASGTRSQILGVQSNVSGDNSVSIGDTNTVASARTYAMGNNINAAAGTDDSLAFGTKAGVGGPNAIALGNTAKASAANTVAISNQAQAKTPYSVALGASAVAGDDSTGALNGGEAAIAIGRQAVANVYNGIAIGKQATIKKDSADGIAIGAETKVNAYKGAAIGAFSEANGSQALAIGNNKQGQSSVASGERSQVIGVESTVSGNNSVAIGDTNTVASARTYVMGNNINAAANTQDSLAFGTRASVNNANAIAMGTTASATGTDSAVAIGQNAVSDGKSAITVGYQAYTKGQSALSIGDNAKANGVAAVAIGYSANAQTADNGKDNTPSTNEMTKGVAIGHFAGADYDGQDNLASVAIGNQAGRFGVGGQNNIAVGSNAGQRVKGSENVAIGSFAGSSEDANPLEVTYTTAVGNQARVKGVYSTAIGVVSKAFADSAVALGHDANASHVRSVALGAGSVTDAPHTGAYTLNNSYTAKGLPNAANGTVSVGSAGKERQIQNVAAGVISATSTDAINGSQLYATNNYLSNLAGGVKNVLGGDAAVDNAGNVTMTNIGGTNENTVDGAIKNLKTAIDSKVDTTASVTSEDPADIKVEKEAPVGNTTNYKLSLGDDAKAKLAKAATALQTVEGDRNITATKDATDPTKVKLALNKDLTADSLTLGDTTSADHVVLNKDGLTVGTGGPVLSSSGIDMRSGQIGNLVGGPVKYGERTAVSAGMLYDVAKTVQQAIGGETELDSDDPNKSLPSGRLTLSNVGETGESTIHDAIKSVNDKAKTAVQEIESANPTALSVKKDGTKVTLTPNFITGDLVNADGTVNAPAAADEGKLVSAKTVADALKANHFVVDTKGNTETGSEADAKVGSGNKVTFEAGNNLVAKQANTANGGATVKFSLKDDISLNSVTAGTGANQVVLGNDGVKVGGNTYINNDGLNANSKVISNVADGVNPNDAVNKSQLDAVKGVADSAVKSVDTVASEENLVVDNNDPQNPKLRLKKAVNLTSIKLDGATPGNTTYVSGYGLTIEDGPSVKKEGINAGDKKITNVAAGDVSATSKDAVNGGQLHNVASSVANVLGGNAAVDGNGNVTSSDIGGTGANTVDDAIKAVNATAAKHTTVVEGKNVKVTKGKNAAGGDEYTVATKDDLDVTSVTAGNTTVNTNGLTITGGPSVTRGGIDAGNAVITNVRDGKVEANSKDAVNGGQLHDTNTKLDGVKAKADTAVQDVKSGDENALTAVKDPNTNIVTVTPKLSGDLVDANGNITAPTTPADKGKLVTAGTVADALANTHFVVDTKATDGELDASSQADQKIKAGNKVTLQAGKNLKAKQTNGANGAQVEFSLKDSISLTQVTAGDSTLNTDGLTIAGGPSVKKDGINAGDKTITNVAPGAVTAASKDAVNGGQLYNVANNVKDLIGPDAAIDPATGKVTVADPAKGIGETGKGTIGEAIKSVKDKADTAVQDIKSGDDKALSVTKAGNTYTITPNLSGDLVDANGNITAPTTPADKGKLVTAGTVADALANTHFVVDTKATDGELDAASQADQKIKASNKVTLQAGKNLKAKQTNGTDGAQVEFSLKDSISLKEVTAGEGANQVVLGNDGVKVGGNTYINNAGLNANGNKITNVADGVDPTDAVNKGQLDAVKAVADSAVKSVDVANGEQNLVVDNSDPKNPKLSLKKDLTVDSVKAGDSTLNTDGLTIAGGPSVKKDGINAGDKTITNVAPGAVTPTSKDAVNGGQLYNVANNVKDLIGPDATIDPATGKVAVADPTKGIGETGKDNIGDAIKHVNDLAKNAADTAKKHTTVEQGDNILVEESTNADGGKHYKVSTAKDLNVDSVKAGDTTVNNDGVTIAGGPSVTKGGINAGGNTITNVADGVNPNDAVNKGQLDAVKGVADSAVKSVDVANGEQNLVVDNSDPKNPKLSLKKDLTVDSVKAGDSTLNNDGLTIAGGPSVKKDGIDAGDKKITNVAAGDVAENSKDAVNGGQLHSVASSVATVLGGNAAVDGNGNVTMSNIGGTGKGNVDDAIAAVKDAADKAADTAKKHTTVTAGKNIEVSEGTNAAGGKEYTVKTADNLDVTSVKAGDTTVNNDGVTINNGPSMTKDGINANNTKVTNVADGVDAADAVNKGQLDKVDTKVSNVAQNVVNVLGGDATVNGNGDITMSNIGETGKGNINDAIKSVNDLAKKAAAEKTSVKAKEGRSNVTVTEGVNAAGGHEYTVDVERSVTNAGSDYVTVTNNHDADSNTTTYTVDVSAKTKASLAKADSAVQGLTSKDGNLNFTKGANGNVEVSFNDNLNVKNVTTDRVQVANGPSMSKDGINAAGKAISNVANGNVAKDSKDAVNGGQLHETAQSVADVIGGGATVKDGKVVAGQNGIGNTGQNTVHGAIAAINQNTANNFNQIRGDLRKMDRDLRGGIAGALATAGLPQAFRPGKSMVAAAASTYRGQSGLAIGVSRISDNGKVILKVTGNTNSRGDFGGTIGAGYQW